MPSCASRRFAKGFFLGLAATASVLAPSGGVWAGSGGFREHDPPAEYRLMPYTGALPSCSDPAVLGEIAKSFAGREAGFWDSGLAIAEFDWPSETGYRTTGLSYIPRRYCRTQATFSDGKRRRVVYNIGEALGFVGIGSGVVWCVEGLDRNHAFSPNCRAAGP